MRRQAVGLDWTSIDSLTSSAWPTRAIWSPSHCAETRKLDVELNDIEFALACLDPATIRNGPEIPTFEFDVRLEMAHVSQAYAAANLIGD